MQVSLSFKPCFSKVEIYGTNSNGLQEIIFNRRTKNFQGCLNTGVEYLVRHRHTIGMNELVLNFSNLGYRLDLNDFLRAGFFDELVETKFAVLEHKLRVSEVLKDSTSYLAIQKDLMKQKSCKYLSIKMNARNGEIPFDSQKMSFVEKVTTPSENRESRIIDLSIGITFSEEILLQQFLNSIKSSSIEGDSFELVACCFGIQKEVVEKHVSECEIFGKVTILSEGWGHSLGKSGNLNPIYQTDENRMGVSWGRSVLHEALYQFSDSKTIWVLDEDMIITKNSLNQLTESVELMIKKDILVGVGRVVGDAPIPSAYTISSQICDFYYARFFEYSTDYPSFSPELEFHDMHHDLAESKTYHVEFPIGLHKAIKNRFNSTVLQGKSVTRAVHSNFNEKNIFVARGGNTIVLRRELLRDFTNATPRICGINLRRGDTHWVSRVRKEIPNQVSNINLSLEQRRPEDFSFSTLNSVRGDIMGSIYSRILHRGDINFENFREETMMRESRLICNLVRTKQLLTMMNMTHEEIQQIEILLSSMVTVEWCENMNDSLLAFEESNV